MSFERPTGLFESSCFENSNFKLEEENVKNHERYKTEQNKIVIPTGKLIKSKGVDIRILAWISSISYVRNFMESGSNTRHISTDKVNKNIAKIAEHLGISPKNVKDQIKNMLAMKTNELELKCKINGEDVTEEWFEINYIKGEFITLPYDVFEDATNILSSNAFKTHYNLRWLCFSKEELGFVERVITQEYLLQLIGLSNSSKKAIRDITTELVENSFITIDKSYIYEHNLFKGGITKEVISYSIVE